jgi:hypothetical protein
MVSSNMTLNMTMNLTTSVTLQIDAAVADLPPGQYVGIYVCGPQAMIIDVQGEVSFHGRTLVLFPYKMHLCVTLCPHSMLVSWGWQLSYGKLSLESPFVASTYLCYD